MSKEIEQKDQSNKSENDNDEGFVLVLLIVASIFALPILVAYVITPHLAEFPKIWIFAKRNKFKIHVFAILSFGLYLLTILPLTKFAIHHGTGFRLLVISSLWILTIPIGVFIIFSRMRKIYSQVKNNDYDPRKIGFIRTALNIADFLFVSNEYVSKLLPLKTKEGNSVLGRVAKFDLRSKTNQISKKHREMEFKEVVDGEYAIFPLNPKSPRHSLVLAETGAGKTVLLSRMALSALSANWKVVIVDFKGATDEANLYCSLPGLVKKDFRSFAFPHQPIDLFWGDKKQVARRLIGFLPPMPQGAGTFYWAREASAISAVVERTSPTTATPKSIPELLDRVRNAGQFAVDINDRNMLLAKQNGRLVCEDIASVLGTYFDYLKDDAVGGTPGGFSFESDFDLAFYSFNGMDVNEVNMGATLISDFAFWIGSPQRLQNDNRPVLLVVDEASALQVVNGSPALTFLVQKARSLGVGIVVASQTLSSLGDTGEEILSSGCIRYLGRLTMPNDAIEASGTKSHVERAYQYIATDGFTGTETLREQNTFTINPDVVRRLPNLSWVVTAQGLVSQIYVPWIERK